MAFCVIRDALLASGGNVVDVRSALLSATGGHSGNSGLSPELFANIVQVQTTGVDLDFLVSCVVVRTFESCVLLKFGHSLITSYGNYFSTRWPPHANCD